MILPHSTKCTLLVLKDYPRTNGKKNLPGRVKSKCTGTANTVKKTRL